MTMYDDDELDTRPQVRQMRHVPANTWYIEMRAPPTDDMPLPPMKDLSIKRHTTISTSHYRYLYWAIGRNWDWYGQLLVPEDELSDYLSDPGVEIHVLYKKNIPVGMVDIDRRDPTDVELLVFGIVDGFVGKGLGRYFIRWATRQAWGMHPTDDLSGDTFTPETPDRIWLHTCELDHPAALPNYKNAGFVVYDEQVVDYPMPEDMELSDVFR